MGCALFLVLFSNEVQASYSWVAISKLKLRREEWKCAVKCLCGRVASPREVKSLSHAGIQKTTPGRQHGEPKAPQQECTWHVLGLQKGHAGTEAVRDSRKVHA